jgi:uncharacterized protein with FMN-binding domain
VTRIATWLAATAATLVLLLSFPTSHGAGTRAGTVLAAGASGSTVTGTAASTRYGDVQVQITVSGKKIVSATAVAYPTGGRDGEISSYAIPILQNETVTAQTAQIDTVSGATFTSVGYQQSLQAAIDLAGL